MKAQSRGDSSSVSSVVSRTVLGWWPSRVAVLGTKASAYQRRRYEPKTFDLLSTREAYNESVFHRCDEEAIKRAQYRLRKQAAQLGFQVIPVQNG